MAYEQLLLLQHLQTALLHPALKGAGPFSLLVIPKEREGGRLGPGSPAKPPTLRLAGWRATDPSATEGPAFLEHLRLPRRSTAAPMSDNKHPTPPPSGSLESCDYGLFHGMFLSPKELQLSYLNAILTSNDQILAMELLG